MVMGLFKSKSATPRPSIVDVLAQFNRPWALRLFGLANAAAALFYGLIATYGLLAKMFPTIVPASGGSYAIADMVALMERSATHTALAGLAFIVGFVTQAAALITSRNDIAPAESPPRANPPR